MKYPEELEMLINAALIDGKISDKEKEILINKAVSMGIEKDEFLMVLTAREFEAKNKKGQHSSSEEEKKAKEWAKALVNRVESTPPIYSPTGKYGKMELDSWKTKEAKEEKLKNVQPTNPYEYNEYLILLKKYKLDSLYNQVMDQALDKYKDHPALKKYSSDIHKNKVRKLILFLILLLIIAAVIFMWAHLSWNWFGKLMLTLFAPIFYVIILLFYN